MGQTRLRMIMACSSIAPFAALISNSFKNAIHSDEFSLGMPVVVKEEYFPSKIAWVLNLDTDAKDKDIVIKRILD